MTTNARIASQRRRVTAALAVVAMFAGGCSSSGGSGNSAGPQTSGQTANATVAAATALLAKATGRIGALPTSTPTPPTDVNFWVISCGQALSACASESEGARTAAQALGWKATLFDGQLNPAKWNDGIHQAISDHADVVLLSGIDCPPVSQALRAVKGSGALILSVVSFDCDDPAFGEAGPPLFDHSVATGLGDNTMADTAKLAGALDAAWVIRDSGGNAKVLQASTTSFTIQRYLDEGFAAELATCGGCEIVGHFDYTLADIGPPLTQLTSSALLQHPDATYLMMGNDFTAVFGNQAVTQAHSHIKVVGAIGDPPNIESIRSGGPQAVTVGFDTTWLGWAAVDDAIRLLNHESPVYSGWGLGVVDAEHLPNGPAYVAPVDYQANYLKLWG